MGVIILIVVVFAIIWGLKKLSAMREISSESNSEEELPKGVSITTPEQIPFKLEKPERDIRGYPTREYLQKLLEFGVTWDDIDQRYEQLSIKGGPKIDEDVVWSLFNELITKTNSYHKLQSIYYSMAIFLNKTGKDFRHVLAQSNKMELLSLKQMGVNKVEISPADNSCSSCRRQKKKYLIEDAIEKMPLPNTRCTLKVFTDEGKGFCRCMYLSAD